MITQSDIAHANAVRDHEADVASERPVRFHTPTPGQTAVRNELEEIGRLDTRDATRMVLSRLAEVDQRLAAGETAEQIAILFTLRDLVGVEEEEMNAVHAYLMAQPVTLRDAASDFGYRELEMVRAA